MANAAAEVRACIASLLALLHFEQQYVAPYKRCCGQQHAVNSRCVGANARIVSCLSFSSCALMTVSAAVQPHWGMNCVGGYLALVLDVMQHSVQQTCSSKFASHGQLNTT